MEKKRGVLIFDSTELVGRCNLASISSTDSSKRGEMAESLCERCNWRGRFLGCCSSETLEVLDVLMVDTLRFRLARRVILPIAGCSKRTGDTSVELDGCKSSCTKRRVKRRLKLALKDSASNIPFRDEYRLLIEYFLILSAERRRGLAQIFSVFF